MNVPGEVSVTLAMHNVVLPASTEAEEQDTLVEVFRGVMVMVKAAIVALLEWVKSPA